MKTVPCPMCRRDMPAARATIAIANGVCATCNEVNLASSRPAAPEYETDVWSRGQRL